MTSTKSILQQLHNAIQSNDQTIQTQFLTTYLQTHDINDPLFSNNNPILYYIADYENLHMIEQCIKLKSKIIFNNNETLLPIISDPKIIKQLIKYYTKTELDFYNKENQYINCICKEINANNSQEKLQDYLNILEILITNKFPNLDFSTQTEEEDLEIIEIQEPIKDYTDFNQPNSNYELPIHYLIKLTPIFTQYPNLLPKFETLIYHTLDKTDPTYHVNTELSIPIIHEICKHGNKNILTYWLQTYPIVIMKLEQCDFNDNTPINYALNNKETLQVLLEYKVELNDSNNKNEYLLDHTMTIETLKLLIQHGAINTKNEKIKQIINTYKLKNEFNEEELNDLNEFNKLLKEINHLATISSTKTTETTENKLETYRKFIQIIKENKKYKNDLLLHIFKVLMISPCNKTVGIMSALILMTEESLSWLNMSLKVT